MESVLRYLNTRARKVLSKPPVVGVRDFVTTESHLPVRVFYPSSAKKEGTVGWFVRSYAYFIDGYFHTLLPWLRDYAVLQWIVITISFVLSWILPLGNAYLPNCAYDAPPLVDKDRKYPLIIFSHGLTGTGEEHALMFSYWAQKGYVIASVHHCDGSSSKVPRKGDNHLLYEHPDLINYDKDFRPRQVQRREEELYEGLQFVLKNTQFSADLRGVIDDTLVIVGGFSYGAATAALSVTKRSNAYTACLLLDGWFYIDLGDGFKFPEPAHAKGLHIPALFIGSEQFANWKGIAKATAELAKSNTHSAGSITHVLQGSRHQNFTDVGFWLPTGLLRKIRMTGECDYDEKYHELLKMTAAFFDSRTSSKE